MSDFFIFFSFCKFNKTVFCIFVENQTENRLADAKQTFLTSTPKSSKLPGLRSSFLQQGNHNRLTSASLHDKSYGYTGYTGQSAPNNSKVADPPKPKVIPQPRKFSSLKPQQKSEEEKSSQIKSHNRKWVSRKFTQHSEASDSSMKDLDCLSKLKASNEEILQKHKHQSQRQSSVSVHHNNLPTIPQETTELCDDCGGATETEDDSGIFTSSHSKHSIDDEMIETEVSLLPSDTVNTESQTTKNFGSESDDSCSRETSPIQLLADLLRRSPENNQVDGRSEPPEKSCSSLVKLRKLQFESQQSDLPSTGNQRKFVSLRQKSTEKSKNQSFEQISYCQNTELIPAENYGGVKMDTSLVSNASRLSICTDCTGNSDENENKFFDDDYTDQQQLILNNPEEEAAESSYHEALFERMDSFLLSKQEEQEVNDNENLGSKLSQNLNVPQVSRVQQIIKQESCADRTRNDSVNTISSLDSDLCMLDVDEK